MNNIDNFSIANSVANEMLHYFSSHQEDQLFCFLKLRDKNIKCSKEILNNDDCVLSIYENYYLITLIGIANLIFICGIAKQQLSPHIKVLTDLARRMGKLSNKHSIKEFSNEELESFKLIVRICELFENGVACS